MKTQKKTFFFTKSFILGVKGLVLNENSQPIPSTQIMIDNRQPLVKVTALGEFWRILLPGTYTLKVEIIPSVIYQQS